MQYVVSDFLLSCKCVCIRLWVKGLGWGGIFHQIFSREFQHAIQKWSQLDLMFGKNEGSIRSKTNEKGCQLDRKLRWKLIQNGKKVMQNP